MEKEWKIYTYDSFDDPDVTYYNLISRPEREINVVAPIKKVRIEKKQVNGLIEKL